MQVSSSDRKQNALYYTDLPYVQIWTLNVSFLKQANEHNHELSEKARLHLENYNFPVEMMVALPNGTIVNIWLFHRSHVEALPSMF